MAYLLRTLQNIARHRWISAATILVMALLVIIFNLAIILNSFVENVIGQANTRVDLIVRLLPDVEPFQVDYFISELKTQSAIKSVSLLTPEEGRELFATTQPELYLALERYGIAELGEIFPYSLSIQVTAPEHHATIREYLSQKTDIVDPESFGENQDQTNQSTNISAIASRELNRLVSATRSLFTWMLIIFSLSVLVITINAIYLSLYTRQSEIMIMRLVGATYHKIRTPYLLEGVLLGIVAVLVGNLIFYFISSFTTWQETLGQSSLLGLVFTQIVIASLTGLVASFIATENYLRRQKLMF